MTVSGYMLAFNEAAYIRNAIDSIYDFVDEIVVILDTKTNDDTAAICHEYGKLQIYEYAFPESYGEQRNRAFTHMKGDFVVTIDPDEVYPTEMMEHLAVYMQESDYDAYAFIRQNFIDGVLQNPFELDWQIKAFRSYCRYEGELHEKLVGYERLAHANFTIKHIKTAEMQHQDNLHYQAMGQVFA